MNNKIKVRLDNGDVIERTANVFTVGGETVVWVRYNKGEYKVYDNYSYITGDPEIYLLGERIG